MLICRINLYVKVVKPKANIKICIFCVYAVNQFCVTKEDEVAVCIYSSFLSETLHQFKRKDRKQIRLSHWMLLFISPCL